MDYNFSLVHPQCTPIDQLVWLINKFVLKYLRGIDFHFLPICHIYQLMRQIWEFRGQLDTRRSFGKNANAPDFGEKTKKTSLFS